MNLIARNVITGKETPVFVPLSYSEVSDMKTLDFILDKAARAMGFETYLCKMTYDGDSVKNGDTVYISPASVVELMQLGYPATYEIFHKTSDPKVIHLLYDEGLDINVMYEDRTPLMSAVIYGRVNCAKALLDLGADQSVEASDGVTVAKLIADKEACEMATLFDV